MKAQQVKKIRKTQGWTQRQLAEYLCVTERTIGAYEQGTVSVGPSAKRLLVILRDHKDVLTNTQLADFLPRK